MKNLKKLSILFGIIPFVLASCDCFEKKAYCVETCDSFEYTAGQYYQACRKDIVESIHLVALPLNPDKGEDEEFKYPFTWNSVTNTDYFSLIGGLEGKRVDGVMKLGPNVLKVNITGASFNKETSGYIKVHHKAFKSYTEETKEAYLYAYVGVGDEPVMKDKEEFVSNCLECSITTTYTEGKCAQVSRKLNDGLDDEGNKDPNEEKEYEKIYLFNNVTTSDIKWKDDINELDIYLYDGLRGKRVSEVKRIDDHILEVEFEGTSKRLDATFGYIRIRNSAFESDNEEYKNKNLYAYVAVGDQLELVDKPTLNLE